jgi:hypothetical protein
VFSNITVTRITCTSSPEDADLSDAVASQLLLQQYESFVQI